MTDPVFDALEHGGRVAIVHGAGRTCRAAAGELRLQFATAGIESECVPARRGSAPSVSPSPPVALVVGVDATAVACRIAVEHDATLVIDDGPGRDILAAIIAGRVWATSHTSPVAVIELDGARRSVITHRAIISTEFGVACTDARGEPVLIADPTQVAIDVPQILPHGPGHDRQRPGPRGILVTVRSDSDERHQLLHPDDRCVVTAQHSHGLHIHIDEALHLRATSATVAPHPVGVRVLARMERAHRPTGRTVA